LEQQELSSCIPLQLNKDQPSLLSVIALERNSEQQPSEDIYPLICAAAEEEDSCIFAVVALSITVCQINIIILVIGTPEQCMAKVRVSHELLLGAQPCP